MGSQNDIQNPKNGRSALRGNFLRMLRSQFVRDLRKRWVEVACVIWLVAFFCWIIWNLQVAMAFAWGIASGMIVWSFVSARDDAHKKDEKESQSEITIGVDYGADGRVATVICERLSDGNLIILDSVSGPPADLEALLEVMMDELAIAAAKSAYAAVTVKLAADDLYDDTGWDEPWAAAVEAAFERGIEELREKVKEVR